MASSSIFDYLKQAFWWAQGKCHICYLRWSECKGPHKRADGTYEANEQDAIRIAEYWSDNAGTVYVSSTEPSSGIM
jgi:hypothetical protein